MTVDLIQYLLPSAVRRFPLTRGEVPPYAL